MPPEEKNKRLTEIIRIILSFVFGAIAAAFTLGMTISKYETLEHAEKTYVRKEMYESNRQDLKEQLNRMENILKELSQTKQDKGGH